MISVKDALLKFIKGLYSKNIFITFRIIGL